MKYKSRNNISTLSACSLLALLSMAVGCVPEADHRSTKVKNAADIEISVGEVKKAPEPEEGAEAPATSSAPSTSGEMAATTSSSDSAAPETTTSASETAPSTAAAPSAEIVEGPAKFIGRVTVKGAAPDLPPLLAKGAPTKDQICSEHAVPNETVVASEGGGLANVFVYMKKPPRSGIPEPGDEAAVIDQDGCVFVPHAAILRVGQKVDLKNSDPVAHNVNVKGFANQFNNTIPPGSNQEYSFQAAERLPANVVCDFHNWMSAWVLPLEHPWGGVTDADGYFEITNLPEGEWEFVVWQEAVGYVERSVKIKAAPNSPPIEINFEVDASKLAQ
ncbi:hypothetical protein KOR42_06740 [Thalassoglobus neptunius]|uniref:Rhamnogalacturonan lyase domain-containing protein n=1 Tax=Thalassoglobus neptunius TaxID=1938619 RepID=A0A5C5X2G8_9PLAN|nr:hypothetical protein [Thalassoglobus neptunius]TWT57314.1 hypothetical protein KOR42_06740 [Thalassoglobus neptunius]